jgi:hypothetical protein
MGKCNEIKFRRIYIVRLFCNTRDRKDRSGRAATKLRDRFLRIDAHSVGMG